MGAEIYMDEPSVTATENLLLLAGALRGRDDPAQRRRRSRTSWASATC